MKKQLQFAFFISLLASISLKAQVNPTGAANIGMPIYTLQEGSLSVPIGLLYDGTGIKTDAVASWAGLNWQLMAGAKIQRIVRDKPRWYI